MVTGPCLRACLVSLAVSLAAQAQPSRIVSTFPSITETLFALGAGDRVVGVSNYCRYPAAALSLPKVGTYTKPDAEKIALLRPDLVFIQHSAANLADRLNALGIKHVEVTVGSLSDVYSMIRDIGRAVGSPDRAEKLNADIRTRLDAFRAEPARGPRPKVLIVIGRTPGMLSNLTAAGPSPYIGELLEIAGGSNVLTGTAIASPRISLETVVRLNPDVILDMSNMGDTGADTSLRETHLREPWLAHREIAAVADGKVFGLTSESLATPGPRVVDAVELIQAKLPRKGAHP
jgi:iron complex transport system substrate-binding protein